MVVMHVKDVEIIDFEDMDLQDATVIAGFPSIGLVSTIAANYLIDALNLKQIGCVRSPYFPALSVVHTGEPLSPVRIYKELRVMERKSLYLYPSLNLNPILSMPTQMLLWVGQQKKDVTFLFLLKEW